MRGLSVHLALDGRGWEERTVNAAVAPTQARGQKSQLLSGRAAGKGFMHVVEY